ncbi:uncharacterized protein ATC70_004000 [Mucor velutinosus]|uniref:Uncharacterized protein n=1 Tax=Mucor velutinosus TaxID=708070 RepID=A0AAN7HY04_9FUNG|nr:hypothetical protein ATC70_004000 [Mucor velutinosus]
MSDYINTTKISAIINSIKDDNSDEINWADFILAAKTELLNSSTQFESSGKMKKFWLNLAKSSTSQLGYKLNTGTDTWNLIEKELQFPDKSNPTTESTASQKQSSSSGSSLGIPITDVKKDAALSFFNGMQNGHKWKLKSGRYVEDVMKDFVQSLDFEHPSMYCVLDMKDVNWHPLFTEEEKAEIELITEVKIEYPPLPIKMVQFLKNLPKSTNINDIYNYLEAHPLDINSEASLVYLKFCLQAAILLIKDSYFQKKNKKERDICSNIWHIINRAFNNSILDCDIEQASNASKESNYRKRKLAASNCMESQRHPLIPDMTISHGEQEYAIIEASRSNNDTKKIQDGGKKCSELMVHIFDQLLATFPTQQRTIKVYGCLLSYLNCTPLELSNPKGYVRVFKQGDFLKHPESSLHFRARMPELLAHIWQFRLAIEKVCNSIAQAENEQSQFT